MLGFAFDFDEENTKTNWGVEATWISKQMFVNNDEYDGLSDVDTINLTVSVDRPTFINFGSGSALPSAPLRRAHCWHDVAG